MKPIFIGIAGGTGAGKTTLCAALQNKYPDTIGLIQLDDYLKPPSEALKFEGMMNWEHPDALYFDKLAKDLSEFSQGHSVVINTKKELGNPDYREPVGDQYQERVPVEFGPKPVMLIEGYLVLFDARVRSFFDTSIYLDLDHDIRLARRMHFMNPEYEKKILIPMHEKFVEPTKQYAEYVIDVSNLTKEQVFEKVETIISSFL